MIKKHSRCTVEIRVVIQIHELGERLNIAIYIISVLCIKTTKYKRKYITQLYNKCNTLVMVSIDYLRFTYGYGNVRFSQVHRNW
jgi:hypothetical protein